MGILEYCKCQETLNVAQTPGSRSLSVTQPNRMCTLRQSLIAALVDAFLPSSEKIDSERENFLRAIQLYFWLYTLGRKAESFSVGPYGFTPGLPRGLCCGPSRELLRPFRCEVFFTHAQGTTD